jgi:hypothetical protein
MSTPATATYFFKSSITNTFRFETGTLVDNDLIRGDDAGEAVKPPAGSELLFTGLLIFDELEGRFVRVAPDILASVTFSDGTTLDGVRGLYDTVFVPQVGSDEVFLLDTAALAAVGKSITDVVDVTRTSFTAHDLNWSDFGFSGTPVAPVLPPPPPPPPVLNVIEGTTGRDVLIGTDGDDLIIANGGNRDRLTGGEGNDTFVFGAQVGNGRRDIAVITDYNVDEDTILITDGAQVSRIVTSGNDVIIHFQGRDGDRIILEDAAGFGPLVKIEFDPDFII